MNDIGRKISYLLRHNPEDLTMDSNGWVIVDELLTKLSISKSKLDHIVDTNNKKRFSYSLDGEKIRANQGHSIKGIVIEMKQEIPPDYLYHGTSIKFAEIISKTGIKKMNRHYVHLSNDKNTAYDVGKRKDKTPYILVIDAIKMHNNGYVFYISENGVWLIDFVPTKYIINPI